MSRTRTTIITAAAAALVVGAFAVGSSHASATGPGGPAGPPSADDSVYAAALGGAADDPGASELPQPPGPGGRHPMGGRLGLRHGPMVGMGQWVLHGESVVKDRDGNFVTVATQSGAVTAVDGTSVTVKSEDGYTRTWTLNDATKYWSFPDQATKADLKVGVDVRVAGSVTGNQTTARIVWFPPKPGTMPHRPNHPKQSEQPHRSPDPGGSTSPGPSPSGSTQSSSTTA